MENKKHFIPLHDLEDYRLSRELSAIAWEIFCEMNWQDKKVIGDQFVRAIDSVGANIAEGYFRFHYLDKIKFYYISRASLAEACEHWTELLRERSLITEEKYTTIKNISKTLSIKLNNFIATTYNSKQGQK